MFAQHTRRNDPQPNNLCSIGKKLFYRKMENRFFVPAVAESIYILFPSTTHPATGTVLSTKYKLSLSVLFQTNFASNQSLSYVFLVCQSWFCPIKHLQTFLLLSEQDMISRLKRHVPYETSHKQDNNFKNWQVLVPCNSLKRTLHLMATIDKLQIQSSNVEKS